MKVSLLNTRITIQVTTIETDDIGNQTEVWKELYSCYATVSSESPLEQTATGAVWDHTKLDFTIRYASEISHLDSTHYRVVFDHHLYNIKGIDHMNHKKKAIKLHCQRVER
ncbi:phage head closure protein [Granulicatella sp. zg-ZJ]|uniref:phage head closure protein n=1 Tax=Granulicatella sp. zg-ZJ TaxID=2678504 RepID=UPI0013D1447B|nr:phage head closure protein [Granulicatella sp. zg-ZJ]NEW62291.1 phage head closure protein [Granulicatella sp. zg-ZJ]